MAVRFRPELPKESGLLFRFFSYRGMCIHTPASGELSVGREINPVEKKPAVYILAVECRLSPFRILSSKRGTAVPIQDQRVPVFGAGNHRCTIGLLLLGEKESQSSGIRDDR